MEINNKSDLLIEIQFVDEQGVNISVPAYDFTIEYYVSTKNKVKASQIGGVLENCYIEDNKLYAVFDAPNLGKGDLMCEKTYYIPSVRFPDLIQKIVSITKTNNIIT